MKFVESHQLFGQFMQIKTGIEKSVFLTITFLLNVLITGQAYLVFDFQIGEIETVFVYGVLAAFISCALTNYF